MTDKPDFEQPQGLIAPHILVDRKRFDDAEPREIVQATVDFVNWALRKARLRRGEFPPEAMLAYHVDYYGAQVENGGHRQFAFNSKMFAAMVADISVGLEAMGADRVLAVYRDFLELMTSDADLARAAVGESARPGTKPPALDMFDRRFFAADDLAERTAAWLRSLPCLKAMEPEEMRGETEAIVARNRHLAAREARATAIQAEADAKNPLLVAAKALCAEAGLTFQGLTVGSHTGKPDEMAWGLRTSRGMRFARLGPRDTTLYLDFNRTRPLVTLSWRDIGAPFA
jgi:hypothetical protein